MTLTQAAIISAFRCAPRSYFARPEKVDKENGLVNGGPDAYFSEEMEYKRP
jgi:hypothetical protein